MNPFLETVNSFCRDFILLVCQEVFGKVMVQKNIHASEASMDDGALKGFQRNNNKKNSQKHTELNVISGAPGITGIREI